MKEDLKLKSIKLRKKGLSYNEILSTIPVAKSTLSLWLRDVGLAKKQRQRLSDKKRQSSLRGSQKRKDERILRSLEIKSSAMSEIGKLSIRELWLIGVALYWAEGSKEKEYHPGSGTYFTNGDPRMIKTFLIWLKKCCDIEMAKIRFEIYIHESSKNNIPKIINYWAKVTGSPRKNFTNIYFKKNKVKTKRNNTGDLYFGLLKIKVKKSSSLLRKIDGWVNGILLEVEK